MNWAGRLQNLLVAIHVGRIICSPLWFSVPEEQEPGILAGSLRTRFPPPYQLLTQEYLEMDQNTGNFYTTERTMDREALCPEETKAEECIILHYAVVGPRGELIEFPVIIEDINDNAPHFENNEIHLSVSEDAAVGTSLLLDVRARDRDSGQNGELHYHLEGSDEVFGLKVEDGLFVFLVVQKALDRETRDRYRTVLVVTDCGPDPLSDKAAVIVTVTDVNDNCPKFDADNPSGVSVPGDSPKNTLVAQVKATDPDLGTNAAIVYSLSPKVSERVKKLFSLESHTGSVRLKQDLQNDKSEELVLRVLASDPRCPPADAHLRVTVLPKMKTEPIIKMGFIAEHQNHAIVLKENRSPTALAVLELEDDSSYKGLSLAIEGDVPFTLSAQNGKYLLSTSKPLDFEMKSEHHISVVARQGSAEGPVIISSRRAIKVLVADVNDNAPEFPRSQYELEVEENNPSGMSLLRVSASDADSGRNGIVTYGLDKHSSSIFDIDPLTGQLSVSLSLDREQQSMHRLTVFARDDGSPVLESTAAVNVRVLDQNDNAPSFFTSHFIFFIPESLPQFAQAGRVGVTDPDEGKNGKTEMHIAHNRVPFVVDNSQGTLRTSAALDRETQSRYEFYLLARDHGRPVSLTSTAKVTVFVEDINDNRPQVILPRSNSSCLTVPTRTAAGAVLTKILATDEDSGPNSEITYTVTAGRPSHVGSPFRVDSRSGNVTLGRRLGKKNMGMHHLFIVVSDGGKPAPLFATVWVNLLVNESVQSCQLDEAPTWAAPPDGSVETPSKAPIWDAEESGSRLARVTLLSGLGMMLASICLLLVTAVLYLKRAGRRRRRSKRESV